MARAVSRDLPSSLPRPKPKQGKSRAKAKVKRPKGQAKLPRIKKAPKTTQKQAAAAKLERKRLKVIERDGRRIEKAQKLQHKIKRATRRPWAMRWVSQLFQVKRDDGFQVDQANVYKARKIADNYALALYKATQRRSVLDARQKVRGKRTPREARELQRIQQFIKGNTSIAVRAAERAKALEKYEPLPAHEVKAYAQSLHPPMKVVDPANLQLLETAQAIRYDKPTSTPGKVKSVGREFGGGILKKVSNRVNPRGKVQHLERQEVRLAPWLTGKSLFNPLDDADVHTHPERMWLRERFTQKYGSMYGSNYPEFHPPQRMTPAGRAKLEDINREIASIYLDDRPSAVDIKGVHVTRPSIVITPRRNVVMWRIKEAPAVDRLDALDQDAIRGLVDAAEAEAWRQAGTSYPRTLRQAQKTAAKYQKVRERLIANTLAREGVVVQFQKKGEKLRYPAKL